MQYSLSFPGGTVKYTFQAALSELLGSYTSADCILLIDSKLAETYGNSFSGYRQILLEAGEEQKSLHQAASVTAQLLQYEAHRGTTLIGIGGGITTDICGFVAATYMRGLRFGFVPTTLLAMCDAAIGGKNGVNFGLQKNLLGTIQQPEFIFYDTRFLETLPAAEWSNGFAEVIKYACLFDRALFDELSQHDLGNYQNNSEALQLLIERCVNWKNNIVLADEHENGRRKLLNFGHTAGHAIETVHKMPHGFAVGIGMLIACNISETILQLDVTIRQQLETLLQRYGLPVAANIDTEAVLSVLKMDKKRSAGSISYILLEDIGKPIIRELDFDEIQLAIKSFAHAGSS
jgi:3-dehydroquinate synthase